MGTYFCEAFSKKALHNKFAFKVPGRGGGEESAVSFGLLYNKMVGKHDVDFIYHLDSKYNSLSVDGSAGKILMRD